MTERDRLLALLPRVYRRDAQPTPTIRLVYVGAGTVTASVSATDGLVLVGTGGAPSLAVSLVAPLTLGDVLAELGTLLNSGVTATLVDPTCSAVLALTLVEDNGIAVAIDGAVVQRWTNPNWRLLDAFALELSADADAIDVALAQLDLLTSGGAFADFWGTLLDTPRHPNEIDGPYTARQLHEVLRHRDNNQALAVLIEEDSGVPVTDVRDLRPDIFRLSKSRLRGRHLPGPRYNAACAEVLLSGFPTAAASHAARANVAGGVTVFVRGNLDLILTSQLALQLRGLQIGTPPPMQIGVTAVGVGQVGT